MENKAPKKNTMNELNKKQVFVDLDTKFTAENTDDRTKVLPTDLHRRTVFDEAYVAMKNARPVPVRRPSPTPKRPAADRNRFRPNKIWDTRLCSGELPADALRRTAGQLLILMLFCFAVALLISVKGLILDRMTDTDYSALARGTSYSAPVGDMEFDFTSSALPDGLAAAQAVCTQLNAPITDNAVLEHGSRPLYPGKVHTAMKSALTETEPILKTNMSNLDLFVQIYQSLEHNMPVIVLLSEKDGNEYEMQYAVVSHMYAEDDLITVYNPNSGIKDYTFEQFIAATRFDNFKDMPVRIRTALAVGSWARNTAIFIQTNNEQQE